MRRSLWLCRTMIATLLALSAVAGSATLRAKAVVAGMPGVHVNAHVPLPNQQTGYDILRDGYMNYWDEAKHRYAMPFFPNVTMGWDSSPRAHQDDAFDASG